MTLSDRVEMRLREPQKSRWIEAARRDGFFFNGEPNVSAWLRSLADARTKKLRIR